MRNTANRQRWALDAFIGLISEKGFAEVTLRDVASAAELGLADLYRLYPDKVAPGGGVHGAHRCRCPAPARRVRPIPRRRRATGCST